MLNYIKADFYRIFHNLSAYIWCAVFILVPPLLIGGAGTQYDFQTVSRVAPACIYIAFMLLALIVSDYTFREEMGMKIYKNDVTCGITRRTLYLSKYFTGVILLSAVWVCCSLFSAVACSAGTKTPFGTVAGAFFGVQPFGWLFMNFMTLALFQAVGVFTKKTSALVLICLVISSVLANLKDLLFKLIPALSEISSSATQAFTVLQYVILYVLPIAGIVILLIAGIKLFEKKEL